MEEKESRVREKTAAAGGRTDNAPGIAKLQGADSPLAGIKAPVICDTVEYSA